MIRVALAGNPNSGKSTLFNGLTGANQSVGNWPGVTVEKKSGKVHYRDFEAEVIDLPGIYSLSTISLEEEIASKYIIDSNMDLIINIVDASNLERNLYLTYQLLDTKIPMVVALNCMDIIEKKLDNIDVEALAKELQVPVIPIAANKKQGIRELLSFIAGYDFHNQVREHRYSDEIETVIAGFTDALEDRFLAIRFFEDGLKAIENANIDKASLAKLLQLHSEAAKSFSLDFDMVMPNDRYEQIINVCKLVLTKGDLAPVSATEKIDRILTNKWLGLPIFLSIMFLVFFLAFGPIGTTVTNWFVLGIDWLIAIIGNGIDSLGVAPWVSSLITNGVFGGLAAVVGFLPQLMILFFFLALLEDSGYMARAAFIMDRVLRKFGLSGKAFIPMLIGFGCSVPAMTSTRTLDRDEDRKITTMIIPFISCGAKAPIYGVFAGALFFRYSFIVVFSMYLLGVVVAILSAILFKKTILRGASANYIMELPEYRRPTAKNTFLHTWERSKGFLVKAGTVLLGAFIVIWFFSYFGFINGTFRLLADEEIEHSILGAIGKFLLPIFRPIGFDSWKSAVAMLTGFIAKESVVGTLGILYGVTGNVVDNGTLLYEPIRSAFTAAQAYAFMSFALLATPCIAALSAMRKELNSWKWFTFAIVYELVVAYLVSFLIYQLWMLGTGTFVTVLVAVGAVLIVFFTIRRIIVRKGVICDSCSSCGLKDDCNLPKKAEFDKLLDEKKQDDDDEI